MAEKKQEKIQEEKIDDLFDILTDENNIDPIVLFDEKDNKVEFEQIAIIPYSNNLYAILKPLDKMEGVAEDEAIVFKLDKEKEGPSILVAEQDEKTAEAVFEEYYKLFDEEAE